MLMKSLETSGMQRTTKRGAILTKSLETSGMQRTTKRGAILTKSLVISGTQRTIAIKTIAHRSTSESFRIKRGKKASPQRAIMMLNLKMQIYTMNWQLNSWDC
jgi:hypothetical protein